MPNMVLPKRKYNEQDYVIAYDSSRLYKAKIVKAVALKMSWK